MEATPGPDDSSHTRVRQRRQRRDDLHSRRGQRPSTPPHGVYLTCPAGSGSRHGSTLSLARINDMISDDQMDTDTYGVSELRDGFFDAMFVRPPSSPAAELLEHAEDTILADFATSPPLIPRRFHWRELRSHLGRLTTTRAGIRLLKSFGAFFVAYALCLVPDIRAWLGRYHYIMPLSAIINHPARAFGAQVDGAVLTTLGTASGLGWGAMGLLLSTSTSSARAGYGGILALFLALFMTLIAFVRSLFIRFYQAVLCAGIAIAFTILARTSSQDIEWPELRSYAVSWLLGQAISLVVNCLVFPDAGSRALATALHTSLHVMEEALIIPRPRDNRLRRRLSRVFVELSQAFRDMTIDMTITRFRPEDVRELRNLMQAVIRVLYSLKTETNLFKDSEAEGDVIIAVDAPSPGSFGAASTLSDQDACRKVVMELGGPTKNLLSCMAEGLQRCDAALMDLSGYRGHMGPPPNVPSDMTPTHARIKQAKAEFDAVESGLLESEQLPMSSIRDADVVQLFVFARHVRQAAAATENLMVKAQAMQRSPDWPRLYLPSYPFRKAIYRTNAQVRHDRGGVTAGSYHIAFAEIERLLDKIKSREHRPMSRVDDEEELNLGAQYSHASVDADAAGVTSSKRVRLRYKIWRVLHRLQGLESRYAFKVCLVTSLLAVPGYLNQDKAWWDKYECWWAVAMGWLVMHTRVGGNLQDLITRAFMAILGAVWSGAAYAAGDGNPFVMAVFAAVYMLPMLYRFTQSSHPRSGLVGCLSFTVISLGLQAHGGGASPALLAVIKGVVFFVGTAAPILVNWVLWPFVARHELRRALSSMLVFMSIIYRSVVARYVYFQEGKEPSPDDVQRSELLEGRLREGFVRIRELLILTQKEMRLRAPFDPLPYSALADACERFFEYLVGLRQSALFYNPNYIRDDPLAAEQLLTYRRDAVAAILANLYILAGALRSRRKVPRYLPSAAAARKRLLVKTAQVDQEMSRYARQSDAQWHKNWSDIYSFSYNESLTGCVAQLEELEKYTKLAVGEQGFDDFKDMDQSDAEEDTGRKGS